MVDRWHVLLCSATPYLLREPLISFQIGCCPNWRPVSVISEVSDFGLPSYTCVRVRRRPRYPGAINQTAKRAQCCERTRHMHCRKLRDNGSEQRRAVLGQYLSRARPASAKVGQLVPW